MRLGLSLLLTTGAAYAFSSAVDLLAGGFLGVYPLTAFVPGVVWSILSTIPMQAARHLARRSRWLAFPYVAFGALATLDGLLHSRPHLFVVAGALFAFGFVIWKASDQRATQSDRDAWLFATLG
jgi:predicted permease